MANKNEYCKYENLRKYPQRPSAQNQLKSVQIEKIPQSPIGTLTRYIHDYERMQAHPSFQFTQLIIALQTLTKTIASTLRNAGVAHRHMLGRDNIRLRNEELHPLFLELAVKLIEKSNAACLIFAKGLRDVIKVDKRHRGRYIVSLCVLDRELSQDAISNVGTLFTIFKRNDFIKEIAKEEILEPGRHALCTGYIVYSAATMFVIALKDTVKVYGLDPVLGEFVLMEHDWKIPHIGYIYSVNEGYSNAWDDRMINYISKLKDPTNKRPWLARYAGSVAADCHRIINQGGIYLYPSNDMFPAGKIGLIYEAIPLAFIAQNAGGAASNGSIPILHVKPRFVDELTPFFFGSKIHVDILVQKYINRGEMGSDYENEEYDEQYENTMMVENQKYLSFNY